MIPFADRTASESTSSYAFRHVVEELACGRLSQPVASMKSDSASTSGQSRSSSSLSVMTAATPACSGWFPLGGKGSAGVNDDHRRRTLGLGQRRSRRQSDGCLLPWPPTLRAFLAPPVWGARVGLRIPARPVRRSLEAAAPAAGGRNVAVHGCGARDRSAAARVLRGSRSIYR